MATVVYTTGAPGSGKSFCRCSVAVIELLSQTDGTLWCNYPLNIELVCAEVAKRRGCHPADVADRINMIPQDELTRWMNAESGPWDFFHGRDLSGCHIGIDEIHNFASRESHKGVAYTLPPGLFERFPKGLKTKYLAMWEMWIGEVRHLGCTIEFLTQDESKVAKQIEAVCDFRYVLNHREEKRDFYTGAKFGDLWNLGASLMRVYLPSTTLVELRKFCGKWKMVDQRIYVFDPFYYKFYDSHSASQLSGASGAITKRPWQTHTRMGLLWWFLRRNIGRLWWRLVVFAVLITMVVTAGRPLLLVQDFLFKQSGITSTASKDASKSLYDAMHPQQNKGGPNGSAAVSSVSSPVAGGHAVVSSSAGGVCASCAKLGAECDKLRASVSKLEGENKKLISALGDSFHFCGFVSSGVMARNGRLLRVGSELPSTDKKTTITAIDTDARTVTLSTGEVSYVP